MAGMGTIIDMAGILAGGTAGLFFSRFLTDSFRRLMITVCGLSFFVIGIAGAMQEMLAIENGRLSSAGTLNVIISLSIGALIGGLIDIDGRIKRLGEKLKGIAGRKSGSDFAAGFIQSSIVVSIGAMAVLGPIHECLYADHSILIAKTVIDCITIMILAVPYGKGCLFSAIPVGICQGLMTLLSGLIGSFMTPAALSALTLTGSVLILATGINLIWDKDIKVVNLTPAIIVAVILSSLIS